MTERRPNLTERAQKVLDLARAAAEQFGHGAVTPIHLALAIAREGSGVASTAMRFHGIAPKDLEPDLLRALAALPASDVAPARLPLNEGAQQTMTDASAEAKKLGDGHIGTEHLLLALLSHSTGVPSQVFASKGIRYPDARARIEWIVRTDPLNPTPFVPPRDASAGAS